MLILFNRFLFTTLLVLICNHHCSASASSIVDRSALPSVTTIPTITTTTVSPSITTTTIATITTTHKIPEVLIKPDENHQLKVPNLVSKNSVVKFNQSDSDGADDVQAASTEHNDSIQNNLSGDSLPQNDNDDDDDLHHIIDGDDLRMDVGGGDEDNTKDNKTDSPNDTEDDGAKEKEDDDDGGNFGVTRSVTEDYRFDISQYMTDASSPPASISTMTTQTTTKDIEATTHQESAVNQHQTTTLDMEKQFDDLKLTTPQTPYFDEKHKQYKYNAGDDDDDDDGDNNKEKVDYTTHGHIDDNDFLSSNIETTTNEFLSFDPTTIVADTDDDEITNNSTDTKNSTYFTNVSVVEQTKYNINSNEVHQINKEFEPATTNMAAAAATQGTKQKKGKYLKEFSEEGSSTPFDLDAVTTDNMNALNESSDNDDLSSALAALKHVEHLTQHTGQAINMTTNSHKNDLNDDDENTSNGYDENKHIKTIIDWASIMENNEYTSDTAQMGNISTTTEESSLDMDTDEVENKVSLLTAIPPKAVDDGKPLDDVSLDDDDDDTTDESTTTTSTTKTIGLSTSTPADIETSSSNNDYDEISTVEPDDEGSNDSEVEADGDTTTTENNFIVRENEEKIKATTSIVASTSRVTISRGGTTIVPPVIQPETTPAPTTTTTSTTTEAIRIEILNPTASASTVNYEKDIVDITSYTEKNAKVDTSLDSSNSIERITEKIIGVNYSTAAPNVDTNIHEGNSLPVDTNQENLKYNTVSETTPKPVVDEIPSTVSTNRTPMLKADAATLSSQQTFDDSLLIPKAEDEGMDVNVIIAISVCTVGLVALILLVGFLVLMRKRQKNLTYGQRCRPVGLDAYSLDNVSVYNSVRRKNNLRLSKRSYGNSAFEDPALKNNMLKIGDLATFIDNQNIIFEEFSDIPMVTARVDEVPAGCEAKNRYANVVPLPETRVHLKRMNDDEKTEYINANYVKGPKDLTHYYIACQAPLENTISDFWRMIWEQNSKVIIMATDLSENGIEKCADYLPPSVVLDCNRQFDDYEVTLKNREVKEKYAVSTVHLKNMQTNTWREITHFWYQWPDTGVPTDEASIIAMLLEARSYLKMSTPEQSDETSTDVIEANGTVDSTINGIDKTRSLQRGQGPITIHCSPGTGRTGTIVACDIAIRALELPTRSVDVPQIVYYVRRGRASSVRTREQYEFIYKVANMYGTKLTGPAGEN